MAAKADGLTAKQEKFCVEYAKHGNAAEAYRAAYPNSKATDNSTYVMASRMLDDVKVKLRIDVLRQKAEEKTNMTIERWAQEVTRLATADIRQIMHPDGRMKMPHELDPDTAAAVASFKIDVDGTIEYKFWPKAQPLDMMAKHKGAYERDNKQKTDPLVDLLSAIGGKVLAPERAGDDSEEEDE